MIGLAVVTTVPNGLSPDSTHLIRGLKCLSCLCNLAISGTEYCPNTGAITSVGVFMAVVCRIARVAISPWLSLTSGSCSDPPGSKGIPVRSPCISLAFFKHLAQGPHLSAKVVSPSSHEQSISFGYLESASELQCRDPGLYSIRKSYSVMTSSHAATRPLGSLKVNSHLSARWSVRTLIFLPSKYCRKYSK